jgi:ectoine hydroxylase-related dioxygenase (phytanoyl-CoA dioxygenase family)
MSGMASMKALWSEVADRLRRPGPTDTLSSSPWINHPEAAQIVSTADIDDEVRRATMELITKGFTILRGVQDPTLCAAAIEDYQRYSVENADYVAANKDSLGRELRLVNFHHYSDAAVRLGTNPRVMQILDFAFGAEAAVYTSLTFKFGTQQPVHRDTPHFATWPDGYFFGVWTALEDIAPEAGPLFYYEAAHHYEVDPAAIWRNVRETMPHLSEAEQLRQALEIYNGEVIRRSPDHGVHRTAAMRRGDVAIWHPQTPHGGMPATDPMRSRWSIVFHCAPKDKQVHQHDSFFRHASGSEPPPRYGYTEAYGRAVALAGGVAFM